MIAQSVEMMKAKTIIDLAREFLDDHGGRTAPAIADLQALLANDEALRASVATEAVMIVAALKVQHEMRSDRAKVWGAANARAAGSVPKAKVGVVALANGLAASLMNFPLAGGLRLGDATREDVLAQAAMYASASRDMGHKARWLEAVAARVAPGQKVREALTSEALSSLQAEAANG